MPRSAKIARSSPSSFCSSKCWLAFDYKSTLGVSILLFSISIIFSVLYFAFPSIFQSRFFPDTILVVGIGFGCGLISLWNVKRSRMIRREIPKDSRRGPLFDEPPEFRDY